MTTQPLHRNGRVLGVMRRLRGVSMIEFVIISPILLLIGLGIVQVGMVFHAKSALNFALQESARLGAVSNGSINKIQEGFVRGLVPFMGGSNNRADFERVLVTRVTPEFARGAASGWIRLRQLSPSPQSFADWAEDGVDDAGNRVREIPNANLAVLRCSRAPNGGVGGVKQSSACPAGERIGADSQQTLADANLLKLELTYGVRMGVPLINRIVGSALAMAAGCQAPEAQRAGALNLGTPAVERANPPSCAHYLARDANGNPEPRIPVNLSVTVRMQSPARFAGNNAWFTVASRSQSANTSGRQLGLGNVDAASQFQPIPVSTLNPNGLKLADDRLAALRGDGSLRVGSNRLSLASTNPGPGGGGQGPGGGSGPGGGLLPPPDCEEMPAPAGEPQEQGVLASVWNRLRDLGSNIYDFVRGFWEGIKGQIGDLANLIMNPVETAQGLYTLAREFINDPQGTTAILASALGRDLSTLVECGAYDRGRILGNYVSPAFMLKLAVKLARFGRVARAVDDIKAEWGCASFAAGTHVRISKGQRPIDKVIVGQFVSSRESVWYSEKESLVTNTFNRIAPAYHALRTEFEVLHVTAEHPLWVQGRGWTPVRDIKAGESLATRNGDTLVLENLLVEGEQRVFNFSVAETESYFVGVSEVWAHNSTCDIRTPGYRAPASPSGYRLGASDGGSGAWRTINHQDTPAYRYQQQVTGAPRNLEYRVMDRDFDGYDSVRDVLLDTKRYTDANILVREGVPDGVRDSVISRLVAQARGQLDAVARSTNPATQVEWHVASPAAAERVREVLARALGDDASRITVVVTYDIVNP